MKFLIQFLVGAWTMSVLTSASADHNSTTSPVAGESYRAYATVVDVDPIVTQRYTSEPETRCTWVNQERPRYYRDARGHRQHSYQSDRYERHYEPRRRSAVPGIIGGLIGSLVGHQFGGGHGKTALTIAGAITGASIGNQIAYNNNHNVNDYSSHRVKRCHTTDPGKSSHRRSRVVENIDGYRVTYRYNGETFTKRMDTHPGKRFPIRVRVTPYQG